MTAAPARLLLGLHAGGREHLHAGAARVVGDPRQQGGLPDSRLARQHERASPVGCAVDQLDELADLQGASEERTQRRLRAQTPEATRPQSPNAVK